MAKIQPRQAHQSKQHSRNQKPSHMQIGFALAAYTISSTMMLVVYKMVMGIISDACVILLIQNGVASALIYGLKIGGILDFPSMEWKKTSEWILVVLSFLLSLISSLQSLSQVSVATLIVFRNLNLLVVAVGEHYLFKTSISPEIIGSMLLVSLGFSLYSFSDVSFSTLGLIWLCVNVLSTSWNILQAKYNMRKNQLTVLEMSFYNNFLSIPPLLLLFCVSNTSSSIWYNIEVLSHASWKSWTVLLLSSFVGCAVSLSGFWWQKSVSSTTFVVVNNLNKLVGIVFGVLFFDTTISVVGWLGILLSLVGGYLYGYARLHQRGTTMKEDAKDWNNNKIWMQSNKEESPDSNYQITSSTPPQQRYRRREKKSPVPTRHSTRIQNRKRRQEVDT